VTEEGWEYVTDFPGPGNWNVRTATSNPRTPILDPEFEYNKTCKLSIPKTLHSCPVLVLRKRIVLPLALEPFPLGSIRPLGWLRQQMELMAEGMPGRMHEFYRLVKDAPWMGGDREYSPLNEAYTYYWDGIVPLAYGLDDQRLKDHVLRSADWLISHQHEDGWFGPEIDPLRRNLWGRYPLFLGFMQLAEAEPKLTDTIVSAMHRFVDLMHDMLSSGHQGYVWRPGDLFDEQWGRSRAADMIIALQWLYEKYPNDNSEKLHNCMIYMYEMAYDWSYWFSEDIFLKDDLDMFPVEVTSSLFPYVHVVNAAQGLKSPAVMRRLTYDERLLNSTRNGVSWTFAYHGNSFGAVIGDEREAGLSPTRGTELCSVVEAMYSLNYLYQAIGDREFADRSELAAYNALPTMILPRWWAHQYIAQSNQPVSQQLERSPFWNVGPFGQTFGTEPNYPCCAVRFSTGLPKWIAAMFMKQGEDGIAHALLGPAELKTILGTRNEIRIRCTTNYPFANLLEYHIKARHPFRFLIRVPAWALDDSSGIQINDGKTHHLKPDNVTGLHEVIVSPGKTKIEIWFGAQVRVDPRANDTIAIHHGALSYSLAIDGAYYSNRPARYPGDQAPDEARDWTILPEETWNLAIDPSTLRFFEYPNRYNDDLPNPIWQEKAPPVSISALACPIDWQLEWGYAPQPPLKGMRNCTGRAFPVELRPIGSAKLHMAELPIVDLSPGSPDLWDPNQGDEGWKFVDQNEL
jgi:Beta-L-arabinofuranosidase, GH127